MAMMSQSQPLPLARGCGGSLFLISGHDGGRLVSIVDGVCTFMRLFQRYTLSMVSVYTPRLPRELSNYAVRHTSYLRVARPETGKAVVRIEACLEVIP